MPKLLDRINAPDDLAGLDPAELERLAAEVRTFLLETLSLTGGHLAPNLGVVELTIALYSLLDLPQDKVIWDVGHQAYTHKLLTGRRQRMNSLRQYGGLSGFPRRDESPYDFFGTGHTSTSLSAAMGFAQARKLLGKDHRIVAVIGDGALTGGMAFEALNHIGDTQTDVSIILNDNEMSIAPNVGALSRYLNRLRSDPRLSRLQEDIENILELLPAIGGRATYSMRRLKEALKTLFVEGQLFEELGYTYLGPIDGHNIKELRQNFKNGFQLKGPRLFHVLTEKGRGFPPAEANPDHFHGTGPFDLDSGESTEQKDRPTYSSVFGQGLCRMAEDDKRVVAITAAMPRGTGLDRFSQCYPERFFDVGIAEQHAVTFASGLAAHRLRPVVAVYSTFLQRAYDQIVHDVCLQDLPVTFAVDRAGLVGADGATHQGVFDLAYLRHIPGMVVMAPRNEKLLLDMLYTGLEYGGPAAVRYPRAQIPGTEVPGEWSQLEIGTAEVLREGNDLCFLAVGSMAGPALAAAGEMEEDGISAGVVDPRFVKPLDRQCILDLVNDGLPLITVEEHVLQGGFGSAVLELLEEEGIRHHPVKRLGISDRFVEHGQRERLLLDEGLSPKGIKEQALALLEED